MAIYYMRNKQIKCVSTISKLFHDYDKRIDDVDVRCVVLMFISSNKYFVLSEQKGPEVIINICYCAIIAKLPNALSIK